MCLVRLEPAVSVLIETEKVEPFIGGIPFNVHLIVLEEGVELPLLVDVGVL